MHRAADSPQEEKAQDADLPELVILSFKRLEDGPRLVGSPLRRVDGMLPPLVVRAITLRDHLQSPLVGEARSPKGQLEPEQSTMILLRLLGTPTALGLGIFIPVAIKIIGGVAPKMDPVEGKARDLSFGVPNQLDRVGDRLPRSLGRTDHQTDVICQRRNP